MEITVAMLAYRNGRSSTPIPYPAPNSPTAANSPSLAPEIPMALFGARPNALSRCGRVGNGVLLRAAEAAGFEAMITADQNIAYQQNLAERIIALVILPTNDWSRLKAAVPQITAALEPATPKSFQTVDIEGPV